MKIEKISFDNLNSLGGHFELDLTHPSLTDAGIFVITGPTGAGKTTLLDAITYAIYGQTARQGKLTASCNEIMTHGARFCRAEAVVEAHGLRYLFSTEQRRKRTRSEKAEPYTTAERRVSLLETDGTATPLCADVNGVRQVADRLMKYENFCRCMMLAQGDFSRFLKADARERSEALATITGTEIYQRIGEKVQEKVAGLKAILAATALLPVLTAEQRAAAEQRRNEQETRCKAWHAELDALDKALSWRDALTRATQVCQSCEARRAQAQAAVQQFRQSGNPARIKAAEAAQAIRPHEVALRSARQALAAAQHRHEAEQSWLRQHPDTELRAAADKAATDLARQQPELESRLSFLAEQVQPLEEAINKAAIRAEEAAKAARQRAKEAAEATKYSHRAAQEIDKTAAAQQAAAATVAALPPLQAAEERLETAQQRAALAYKIQSVSGKLEELYREFAAGKLSCCPCCGSPVPHRHPRHDSGTLAAAQQEAQQLSEALSALKRQTEEARTALATTSMAHATARKAAELARAEAEKKAGLHQAAERSAAEAQNTLAAKQRELAFIWQGGSSRHAEQSVRAALAQLQKACAESKEALQRFILERESHCARARAALEQLPQLREKEQQASRRFSDALCEHGFADEAACAAALLPAAQLEQLRQQEAALTQTLASAKGACQQAAAQQEELHQQNLSPESHEELTTRKSALSEVLEEQDELLKNLHAELLRDDAAQRANAQQEAELADTRCQLAQWQRLYEILGNTRDGFKKYAQRITFNLLLQQANAKLRLLSERYTLVQDTQQELGLRVIDRYQDDEKGRSCSNLSGGESFIVSLALALGLSHMTGETRIDTLFMDEGFGTLDEDALEQVLHCLQSLRADGKLIGIISHVEALKERIPANIELLPRGATGLSTLAAHAAVVAEPG